MRSRGLPCHSRRMVRPYGRSFDMRFSSIDGQRLVGPGNNSGRRFVRRLDPGNACRSRWQEVERALAPTIVRCEAQPTMTLNAQSLEA